MATATTTDTAIRLDRIGEGRIRSYDPMTLEPIGEVPLRDAAWVRDAVARARVAQPGWWRLGLAGRRKILDRAREALLSEARAIAERVAHECGKTYTGALLSDVNPSADWIGWAASAAADVLAPERLSLRHYALMGRRSHLVARPIGVVGVISPWNFPLFLSMQSTVSALATGNAVILKPSEITPLSGLEIGRIFHEAGVPEDVLIVATGDGRTGAAVVEHTDKIFFIGSGRTGHRIHVAAAERDKCCVLELGGNAPAVVLADAHLDNAVRGLVWGAFFNAGQVCASAQRVYVARPLYDRFVERFVEHTRALRVGDDREHVDIGSLTWERQLEVVEGMIGRAREEGAEVLTGGRRVPGLKGLFYEPTVLVGVERGSEFTREELFGPGVMIAPFDTEEQAVQLANDTPYGLHASVWSRDVRRATRIAERIDAGAVSVNDHLTMAGIPDAPWGGVKASGIGVIGSRYGLLEFVSRRHVHVNRYPSVPMPWWFPESERLREGVAALGEALAGTGLRRRARAAWRAFGHLRASLGGAADGTDGA
ncbi:MAG: aldehyde dehydrogenase family protein [Planctomycetota bacterium]|nr:MAG: aldehyde dehydrogenase family protein [Planctomycetota bacterium]